MKLIQGILKMIAKAIGLLIAILLLAAFVAVITSEPTPEEKAKSIEELKANWRKETKAVCVAATLRSIKPNTHNPDSFKINYSNSFSVRSRHPDKYAVSVEYSGSNLYGARVRGRTSCSISFDGTAYKLSKMSTY